MRARYVTALLTGTLLIYLIAGGARALRYGDCSAFAGFGCVPNGPCFARENAEVLPKGALLFQSGGYDGQFYYYLAAEIAGVSEGQRAVLDADAFRRARVGYPLLAGWAGVFGPRVLLAAMVLVPLLLHLLSVALLGRWIARMPRSGAAAARIALAIYALNPVSLFSWLYLLADGVALALLAMSLTIGLRDRSKAGRSRPAARHMLASAVLLALAVLSKEHALVGVAVFAASGVARLLRFGLRNRAGIRSIGEVGVAAVAVLVLSGWWFAIGFSPSQAAERGGWPFAGVWLYLSGAPDAALSGRSYLLLYLIAWLTLAGGLAAAMARRFVRGFRAGRRLRWPSSSSAAVLAGFSAGLALLSFATAHEYWSNYANILRLFAPGFAVLVLLTICLPVVFGRNRRWSLRGLVMRIALYACALATVASLHGILESEISGRLQPTQLHE